MVHFSGAAAEQAGRLEVDTEELTRDFRRGLINGGQQCGGTAVNNRRDQIGAGRDGIKEALQIIERIGKRQAFVGDVALNNRQLNIL